MKKQVTPFGQYRQSLTKFALVAGLLACLSPLNAQAAKQAAKTPPFGAHPDVPAFIEAMHEEYGFDVTHLTKQFDSIRSNSTVLKLIKPAAVPEQQRSWQRYRARFLTERRITNGLVFWQENGADLARAEAIYDVPQEIIVAIIGVETEYGQNMGSFGVLEALATLAFDYPPRQAFFRGELEQYLVMAREEGLDPLAPVGSYAGAMGLPQFMPSSFRSYAVDGDADGKRDLWNDWADVFSSVGNYLKVHGWRAGEPVLAAADASNANLAGLDEKLALTETVGSLRARGVQFETGLPADAPAMLIALKVAGGTEYRVGFTNFYAITRYNRSHMYASAVSDLADAIGARRSGQPLPAGGGHVAPAPNQPAAPSTGWSTTTSGT